MTEFGAFDRTDDWYTPKYIFDALGVTFDIDVAAPRNGPRYVPARGWYCEDGLGSKWPGDCFVWMNPPFGHQSTKRVWLKKFFDHANGIALIPDRTSAPWFQEYVPLADVFLIMSPKVKFERCDGSRGEQPGNGTILLAAGERATSALMDATSLGFLCTPSQFLTVP